MPKKNENLNDKSPEDGSVDDPGPKDDSALRHSILDTLMELSEDLIVVLDETGLIIEAGYRSDEVLGVSRDAIVGLMPWESFVVDDDIPRLKTYFRDRAKGVGNPPSTYTLRLRGPAGEPILMRANVRFIPGTGYRVVILKDLSEVVHEQRRTAESEDRYRRVIENTRDGIIIATREKVVFANTSFCRMTGAPREEIYTSPPFMFFSAADRKMLEGLFTGRETEGEGHRVFETAVLRRKGPLPVELSAAPIVYRNTQAVLISLRDLSQRRRTERELRNSHGLLKAIVDNSPVAVSVHDRYGALLMANDSWLAIWGKTAEDLREKMKPRRELLMNSGDSYLGEYLSDVERVYRSGGELYIPVLKIPDPPTGGAEYISHHFYALKDDHGAVDKVVILTLDLTESLRTKYELKETRDRHRELFTNIPVAVFRTSLEPGGRIFDANPEMERMFRAGEGEHDLYSIPVRDLYIDPERRSDLMQSLLEDREVRGFEAELRRLDGSTFLASISARKVSSPDGSRNFIEGIIGDITEKRRMEEEMANIEHLESIGTLAGGIAHDFNNILMAVQGSISLARGEGKDPSSSLRHLDNAEASVREATLLTKQLLTFSKGGMPVKDTVDVETCVRDSVEFSLRGSEAEALFDFEEGLWTMDADREQMAQVIRNMVLNSVQAMSSGGRIEVSCGNEMLDEGNELRLPAGRYVKLSIRDNGMGIPRDDLKKVFNPYFTTKEDGTGLGLATCYSIVKKHSGSIHVNSEEGEGTEFMIHLPAAVDSRGKRRTGESVEDLKGIENASILIMDDDPKVRAVLRSMLEILGYEVAECGDGDSAVRSYAERLSAGRPYDAVIMDLTVPGGKGGETAVREMRAMSPSLRAIVSSGYANNPVLAEYDRYGFDGSLVKPFSLSVLRDEMAAVLTRKDGGERK